MKSQKNKFVWACSMNLCGLIAKAPLKCYWDEFLCEYYHKDGNFSVKRTGLDKENYGYIVFASESRQRVLDWIKGARCVMGLLQNFSN